MWQSGHPWMYSGAVENKEGNPEPGSDIDLGYFIQRLISII